LEAGISARIQPFDILAGNDAEMGIEKQEQTISRDNGATMHNLALTIPSTNMAVSSEPHLSSLGSTSTVNEPEAGKHPREAGETNASEEAGQRAVLDRTLAQEPPLGERSGERRRPEVDGENSMNEIVAWRDVSPARTTASLPLTVYSVGASTLPPPYAEYN
jgi:hypothetical protein